MKSNYTHVSILIDRSGSMSSMKLDVIGGFNQLIEDQKKEDGELTVSLTQFDSAGWSGDSTLSLERTNDFSPVDSVVLLNESNYIPRGGTPLNDALGITIKELGDKLASLNEEDRPEKVIVVVITDGEENSSRQYTTSLIKEMIQHQETTYNWKFIYLGANQDSFQEGGSRGFSGTMNWEGNVTGSYAMYTAFSKTLSKTRGADYSSFIGMNYSVDLDIEYQKAREELSNN
jgi:uncharacterized protein YegL